MPLFKKSSDPVTSIPPPATGTQYNNGTHVSSTTSSPPRHSHGLFSSTSSSKRRASSNTTTTSSTPSSSDDHTSRSSGLGSLFHRGAHRAEDPSIVAARQRVESAEKAEVEADRALGQARAAVADARQHVLQLEREAGEEARLAKIKQGQAADLGRRAKPLGRHGY